MAIKPRDDVRWKQRLENLQSAFIQLKNAVELSQQRPLSDLEQQGLIQAFEFNHELAWNVMKDYFKDQGGSELITGSKDATREAFKQGLIEDGESWMEMIISRNQTSHTYNKEVADEIVEKIKGTYFKAFTTFIKKMTAFSING
jgi:nucleotidyltransferase substrate binding protein (TIGR01987 family)